MMFYPLFIGEVITSFVAVHRMVKFTVAVTVTVGSEMRLIVVLIEYVISFTPV
jgi:hypothetical protein